MKQKVIQVRKISHRGQEVWMMSFPYDHFLIQKMKSIQARYSKTYRSWYIPYDGCTPDQLIRTISVFATPQFLHNPDQPQTQNRSPQHVQNKIQDKSILRFQTTLQAKGYSASTVKSYTNLIIKFLNTQDSSNFTREDIENYIVQHL